MTHTDNWEPVRYRDLPDWVKEDSKPRRWVRNTYKTVFSVIPTIIWSSTRWTRVLSLFLTGKQPIPSNGKQDRQKKFPDLPRLLYGVIIFVVALVGLVFLFGSSFPDIPSPAISPPVITSEVPNLSSPLHHHQARLPRLHPPLKRCSGNLQKPHPSRMLLMGTGDLSASQRLAGYRIFSPTRAIPITTILKTE